MRVVIKRDYDECSRWAAHYVAQKIIDFAPSEQRPFSIGLPTGSSPLGMYANLAELCKKKELSFKHVISFNMDEYVGIKPEDPRSYRYFMEKSFFSRIDIERKNIYFLDGAAIDAKEECERFETSIRENGGIRLFVAGMGTDGHIAFNEPGSSLSSRTRIKTLLHDTRIANARFFGGDVNAVPRTALTVGVETLMEADEVLLLVMGYNKARALKHCIERGVNHQYTASCLQMHSRCVVICDDPATDELMVRTVRYFKKLADELE